MALFSLDRLWRRPHISSTAPLVVGLVNNMPDAALKSTERQFRELLASAAGNIPVRLRTFSLPEVPRSPSGQAYVSEHHEPIDNLWSSRLDGLIVTGNAPRAARLDDEPYWPALARLVDWADSHTISSLWSCLAAHAAVYRLDGIERRPLARKLSGVFDCFRVGAHPLIGFGPGRWRVPHSRHNDLPERALAARGYRILAWSDAAGADLFIKRRESLFVFLQGHPEYDAGALLREYRRDVTRFLAGDSEEYPELPVGYLDVAAEDAMRRFAGRALAARDTELMADFPAAAAERDLGAPWRGPAAGLYAHWLSYLDRERVTRSGWVAPPLTAPAGRVFDPTYA
jgi:homoserine O-succinyltransferase/O-acetyltransferase